MTPLEPDAARRLSGVTGDPAVLWVGRLNANKDPLCAVEGFAGMLAHGFLKLLRELWVGFHRDQPVGDGRQAARHFAVARADLDPHVAT